MSSWRSSDQTTGRAATRTSSLSGEPGGRSGVVGRPVGRPLSLALGLYVLWLALTYLLEGRPRTLIRPEAAGLRLAYALVANIAVGVVGASLVLRSLLRSGYATTARIGLRARSRTLWMLLAGLGLGSIGFGLQRPATLDPVVLLNGFAQVWVASLAEVLVCWAVVGNAVRSAAGRMPSGAAVVLAGMTAAVLFGVYHFAHSPPFNTPGMVGLLTGVGLVTGGFYFLSGELYGTVMFHNMLALKGVTDALAAGGHLERYGTIQSPLIVTAVAATAALIAVDRRLRRQQ